MRLVLLLALVLPLQSFASVWSCGSQGKVPAAAHQHCVQAGVQTGGAQPAGAEHHHCGTCCVTAVAATPPRWTPPRPLRAAAFRPPHRSAPAVILDRLDRPPRSV